MKRAVFLIFLVLFAAHAEAKRSRSPQGKRTVARRPSPPAYRPPLLAGSTPVMPAPMVQSPQTRRVSSEEFRGYSRGIGLEVGVLGRSNSTDNNFFGTQAFFGGRVSGLFEVHPRWYLQPSVGFFRRGQGIGMTGVNENLIETGLTVKYRILGSSRVQWLGGLVQRIDLSVTEIEGYGSSSRGPLSFRYRVGPGTGVQFELLPAVWLASDLELSLSFTDPTRTFLGWTGGVVFPF